MSMSTLARFHRMMPEHIKRKFANAEELMAWHREQGEIDSKRIIEENRISRLNRIMGRSGISPLHQNCTFDNYIATTPEQQRALVRARQYAENFGNSFGGFIFSGNPGTGKNHLAAAIGNHIIQNGNNILIATLPDLMMRVRETYQKDTKISESALVDDLCAVDLLVLDDVGVQRNNLNEDLIIFQVVDRRLANKKPVGVLTNLDFEQLTAVLGERVIDRLRMGTPTSINFNWQSYRRQVK
ncbi:ATP-binding protein [Xenorhabdus griffiniae]|uniref:ATP-binding protein n=1 Tax=Xenorhabdus griffiniae TaxID=351672 RepID=A0ABY9XKP5_9GAMM|nr:ATP-binding protein [Xenorhabdus griffiniae]MBD1229236.1 ATP-binding protein [Xenorhabdus griffiniae]MBE8588993.1 ATP-binding protein [Xenorhabdus griffiniae]WMV73508.1 ATP-binding protein [Xenorhabdus griffiniae]WNH03188.1 ATP-binding protein [Xenorhabdus griffiniae]